MWVRHLVMFATVTFGTVVVGSQLRKPQLVAGGDRVIVSKDMTQVVSAVNAKFQQHWNDHNLSSAGPANNLLVARRLSLALTGTVPSLEEIRALELIEPDQQIRWWLQHLFADQRCSDYVAERLARAYVGTEDGPFLVFRRRRFVSWLSDALFENRPYDNIVRSLINGRGAWTDSPGVNFITVTNGTDEEGQPDEARLAARTTRAFLGVRLDCMQCHDDNLGGDWLQSDFHQLAAFFSEARSSGLGIQDTDREYEFTYLNAEQAQIVEPQVPFAGELLTDDAETRRAKLAAWVTHPDNRAFSRATVNRFWALLFGRPLVEPIDDIPLEGPYPPGLERLATDFAANGFDIRRLIAEIAMTDVFRQESRSEGGVTPNHEEQWAVFPLTRLRPEQVAGGVVQSASLPTIDSNSHIFLQFVSFTQIDEFVKRYGDTGEDEFDDRGGTIPQRLVMLNGQLVKERTKDDMVSNAATRIAQQVSDNARAVELAFLVVLTRRPTEKESEHFAQVLENATLDTTREERLEDLFWALLNSAEFSWNH